MECVSFSHFDTAFCNTGVFDSFFAQMGGYHWYFSWWMDLHKCVGIVDDEFLDLHNFLDGEG